MATFGNTGGRPDQWLSTFEWVISENLPNDSWVTSRASRYGVYDPVGRARVVHVTYWAQVLRGGQSSILKIVAEMDEFFAFDRQAREQGLTDRDREVLHPVISSSLICIKKLRRAVNILSTAASRNSMVMSLVIFRQI